jgi:hypothetical protein
LRSRSRTFLELAEICPFSIGFAGQREDDMRIRTSVFSICLAVGAVTSVAYAQRSAQVCQRWAADRVDRSEGTWTGNADACMAGDVTEPGRTNALKILNLYRFLAEMPEVTTDPVRNQKAQECALMQSVNGGLSHTPPTTWKCYTADGAEASGKSNISGGKGVSSMDAYMTDRNVAQMGHRRWILANSLGPVGLGSATASCFWNLDGTGKAGKAFVPWPPSGPVPFDVFRVNSLDTAGWTIQSDSINLGTATVTVADAGQDRPVTVSQLPANYGSRYAIKILPNGWTSQAGHTYAVSVQGTTMPIAYSVEVIDCANVDGGAGGSGGTGGTGGVDAGTAGRGGGAGTGATGGAAGSGGTGGAAGSGASGGTGGTGTTGGAAGSGATGGAGGSGGAGAGTGTGATGGATTGSGGGGAGGAGGAGASGGSGGVGQGGSGTGASGGVSGAGGSDAGSSGRAPGGGVEQGGCSCSTPGRAARSLPIALGLVALAITTGARRRRRRK